MQCLYNYYNDHDYNAIFGREMLICTLTILMCSMMIPHSLLHRQTTVTVIPHTGSPIAPPPLVQLLSLTAVDVWASFLAHNHIKDHPGFKECLPKLLSVARRNLFKVCMASYIAATALKWKSFLYFYSHNP